MVALNVETGYLGNGRKSGVDLRRVLVFDFETKSVCNVVSNVQMIRNAEKAKSMTDVQPWIATLQRRYIEQVKEFNASRDQNMIDAIAGLKDLVQWVAASSQLGGLASPEALEGEVLAAGHLQQA